jgi:6-pyruvoyltetrahydropterin/6-carboxytetrahydropterin synthase
MLLKKTFRFEASHILPLHPGKCSRLHGHSWVLHVYVRGKRDPKTGMVMDYADISEKMKPVVEDLDHRHLGAWEVEKNGMIHHIGGRRLWSVPWLPDDWNPTSENLLYEIGRQLYKVDFYWSELALEETCTSWAALTSSEFMEEYSKEYGVSEAAKLVQK